jgi:type II secretion system protein G
MKQNSSGFTLVELLVVVAILGLLLSLVTISFQEMQSRSLDSRRMADIGSLQKALALYQVQHAQYPVEPDGIDVTGTDELNVLLLNENFLSGQVKDPINGTKDGLSYVFHYLTNASGSNYLISFCLETDSIQGKVEGCGNEVSP